MYAAAGMDPRLLIIEVLAASTVGFHGLDMKTVFVGRKGKVALDVVGVATDGYAVCIAIKHGIDACRFHACFGTKHALEHFNHHASLKGQFKLSKGRVEHTACALVFSVFPFHLFNKEFLCPRFKHVVFVSN